MSETNPREQLDEATLDLLVKQATEGLSPPEQRLLDVQAGAATGEYLRDFERAAAAAALAASVGAPPLPPALAARLVRQGRQLLAPQAALPQAPPAPRPRSGGTYGWLAAAACLLLAVFGWMRSPAPLATPPTPAQARAALLAKAESVKLAWGATQDPLAAGVSGDVVWDPATQRGFMHFVNLPGNDPRTRQYQLWIFDATRDARYPVDGGVFDVPANATDVIVPIRAAIDVRAAQAFAVTVEKPGGVVVSGREHIIVLAKSQPG